METRADYMMLLSMSNKGLIGSGTLKHLTSTTKSEEYKFFPDSMITQASTFDIEKDESGIFPSLKQPECFNKMADSER